MNYLEQIVAFYRWKEVNPLPASAIALWYEIMAVCNKAGWPGEFTVPNAVLQSNAGLSRKQFDHARQMLIDLKRIHYKKSTRVNNAGKYSINYFPIVQKGQQEGQRQGNQKEHDRGNERDTLSNKPKPNKNGKGSTPLIFPQGGIPKTEYAPFVLLTPDEHQKLTELLGEEERDRLFLEFASWISGKPAREQKTRSAYLTILNWDRRNQNNPPKKQGSRFQNTMTELQRLYAEAEAKEREGN